METKHLFVVLLALFAATGTVLSTGAFTSSQVSRTADVGVAGDEGALLALEPHGHSPNGEGGYAALSDGQLTVRLDGIPLDGLTTVDRVFNVSNHGTQRVGVYVLKSGPNADLLSFATSDDERLDNSSASARCLDVGEAFEVGIAVDTRGAVLSPDAVILDGMTVVADAEIPCDVGGGDGGAGSGGAGGSSSPGDGGAGSDPDGDGVDTATEESFGTDPDARDSDGDGIDDYVETSYGTAAVDTDGDGPVDALDLDSDDDGIPDSVEGADDADGDGTPNYRDADSDGAGDPDGVGDETAGDDDGDGTPNFADGDNDGDGTLDGSGGSGSGGAADDVDLVAGSGLAKANQGDSSGIQFKVRNDGDEPVTIAKFAVDTHTGPEQRVVESNGGHHVDGQHEVFVDASTDGLLEMNGPAPYSNDQGQSLALGTTAALTEQATLDPGAEATIYVYAFRKNNGDWVSMIDETVTVTLHFDDGTSQTYQFVAADPYI